VCGGVCRKNARLVAVFTAWLRAAQGAFRFCPHFGGSFQKSFYGAKN
jgi:hypothetical protein